MVHITKALIIASIAIAPAFAAPIQLGQDDVELIAREPFGFLRKALRHVNVGKIVRGVRNVVRKVAPIASMIPGPIGIAAGVASRFVRRDLEDELYTRAVQDELNARGYDIDLELREIEGLEARDLTDALQSRDNIYTISARAFVDSIELEARNELTDGLEARELESFDELD
jgi:hypothetical protein